MDMQLSLLAVTTTQKALGLVIAGLIFLGGAAFVVTQMIHGRRAAGAEIELAPNRKKYFDDDKLETTRLNWALWSALGLLVVIALTLPLYWLAEGGRQHGAVKMFEDRFIEGGLKIYTTEAQCVNCHGPKGTGGSANYVITDEKGQFVQQVTWTAPALDTVLWRHSEKEVRHILDYGRPGTPMAAWGTLGGGALSDQQVDNVIDYLWSIQLTPAAMQAELDKALEQADPNLKQRYVQVREANAERLSVDPLAYNCPVSAAVNGGPLPSTTTTAKPAAGAAAPADFACLSEQDNLRLGEIIFNLGTMGGGASSCARCHVPGANFGQPWGTVAKLGRGSYAPNLIGIEQNLTVHEHFNLIMKGTEDGKLYGSRKQGSGNMPGFGVNPNKGLRNVPQLGDGGMLSPEAVWAIVVYERKLSTERPDLAAAGTPSTPQASN
jgi:mono/diheme cytochrome c family protein